MDTSSYFIKDKALFGSYPSESAVKELESNGVKYFVNLTYDNEDKITQYTSDTSIIISYQIKDRSIPEDIHSFTELIIHIADIIKHLNPHEKIYIHCKGGHGRAGLVVACLICFLFNYSAYDALQYTSKCHNNRLVMRDKWRKIGSPQTYCQKKFVYQIFRPVNYTRMCKGLFSLNSTELPFTIDNETFDSLHMALKTHSVDVVYTAKINQHDIMKNFLLQTYLKPIVSYDNNNKLSSEICTFLSTFRLNLFTFKHKSTLIQTDNDNYRLKGDEVAGGIEETIVTASI